MKALHLALGFALILGSAGCGESDQQKRVMPDVEGRQLDVALSDIERTGFENEDDVEIIGGGTFGIRDKSNWQVCDQLPAAGQALNAAPRLTVDRSCGDEAAATTIKPEPTTKHEATTVPEDPVLTAATNADLSALLTGPECDETVAHFASQYRGRKIEFDGSIGAMNKHGSRDTRYDILVSFGDYSETHSSGGPSFQFRDVGIADLHLSGPNIPDTVGRGDNLHVIAEVREFNSSNCVFQLVPVSTQVR